MKERITRLELEIEVSVKKSKDYVVLLVKAQTKDGYLYTLKSIKVEKNEKNGLSEKDFADTLKGLAISYLVEIKEIIDSKKIILSSYEGKILATDNIKTIYVSPCADTFLEHRYSVLKE